MPLLCCFVYSDVVICFVAVLDCIPLFECINVSNELSAESFQESFHVIYIAEETYAHIPAYTGSLVKQHSSTNL